MVDGDDRRREMASSFNIVVVPCLFYKIFALVPPFSEVKADEAGTTAHSNPDYAPALRKTKKYPATYAKSPEMPALRSPPPLSSLSF